MQIRKAVEEDAKDISYVNIHTWNTTYRGIISDEFLEKRLKTIKEDTNRVRERIKSNDNYYVAIVDEKIVGMMTIGKSSKEQYPDVGEILSLYILKEYQGQGIGKQLLKYGFQELDHAGYQDAIISCLKENPSIKFYESIGGTKIGETIFEIENNKLLENIYYYKNIKYFQ